MKSDEVLARLGQIKKKIEKEQREADRIEGKIDAKMEELKEMGFPSIEEAEEAIEEMEEELEEMESELQDMVESFAKKYPDLIK